MRPDFWDSCLHTSQSNRTGINDKVMHLNPVYDNFSKNDHLDYYKQNLVSTQNVDRIVPFKHSQNYRGAAMDDLRPISKKCYPKTTCQQLRTTYFDNIKKKTLEVAQKSNKFLAMKDNYMHDTYKEQGTLCSYKDVDISKLRQDKIIEEKKTSICTRDIHNQIKTPLHKHGSNVEHTG